MTWSHKEAEFHCCSSAAPPSLQASPPAPRGSWRKRALFRSTWIYVGEPETAGDGNCWPSRLAVGRGFWQGSKWTQWVTLSFPVSLPFYSLFTVFLSQPAFIYCPCLPARITSSNRKQMNSSESEVAVLCPSHHQGNTSDIHFHILGAKICLLKSFWINALLRKKYQKSKQHKTFFLLTRLLMLPKGETFLFRFQLGYSNTGCLAFHWQLVFDFVPAPRCSSLLPWKQISEHTQDTLLESICGVNI